jgi:hypothetical protein
MISDDCVVETVKGDVWVVVVPLAMLNVKGLGDADSPVVVVPVTIIVTGTFNAVPLAGLIVILLV